MNVREWALPVYTILIQLASGSLLTAGILRAVWRRQVEENTVNQIVMLQVLVSLITIFTASVGAHFHLSKPFISFYALWNLDTSWLSREILFTVLFGLATATLWLIHQFDWGGWQFRTILGMAAVTFGFATIFCMAQIYLLPTQVVWNAPFTLSSFLLSSLLLGLLTVPTVMAMDLRFTEFTSKEDLGTREILFKQAVGWFGVILVPLLVIILTLTFIQVRTLQTEAEPAGISLELLLGLYLPLLILRMLTLVTGSGWFIMIAKNIRTGRNTIKERTAQIYLSCLLVLIGEIMGRFLFYATHVRIGF